MRSITFRTSGVLRKSALRQANARLVINAIRSNPGISRADIVRLTGFSASSVTHVVNSLKQEGWLDERKIESHSKVGRRPTGLHLCEDSRLIVGVEISLSNPHVVLADMKGRIQQSRRLQWQRNPTIFLETVRSAIAGVTKGVVADRLLGVGVSITGNVNPSTGRVIAAENLGWMDVEAGKILERGFSMPFHYENDGNLAALAEISFANPEDKPLRNFVSVAFCGGVGTGVYVNGESLHGAGWMGGEFGHTMLYADGLPCTCGNRGCWEQYASDTALRRLYAQQNGHGGPTGEGPGADEIIRLAREGDPTALRVLRETAGYVGLGLVNVIVALNPEAIVLSNYVAEAWDLVEATIWEVIRQRVARASLDGLRISPSELGPESSILGAVALVLAQFFMAFDHEDSATDSGAVSMRPGLAGAR